jgi:hypothetical protein
VFANIVTALGAYSFRENKPAVKLKSLWVLETFS